MGVVARGLGGGRGRSPIWGRGGGGVEREAFRGVPLVYKYKVVKIKCVLSFCNNEPRVKIIFKLYKF